MISRIKLGLSIIFGKNVIVYDENTKAVVAMVGGRENVLRKGLNIAIDKYVVGNKKTVRYLGGK